MYVPAHFKPDDDAVRELLRKHGAADLITFTPKGLLATMLPFVYQESEQSPEQATGVQGALLGHVARSNNHWRESVQGEAMAIIRGPDAYITPTWYATKREHGRVVPTWNYITAHVYGTVIVHDDPTWVADNVERLTAKYEATRAPAWSVADAPPTFIEGQLRAIVGVELRITRLEAKFKLSQNRSEQDVNGVVRGLAGDGQRSMAEAVHRAALEKSQ